MGKTQAEGVRTLVVESSGKLKKQESKNEKMKNEKKLLLVLVFPVLVEILVLVRLVVLFLVDPIDREPAMAKHLATSGCINQGKIYKQLRVWAAARRRQ
jgi:hypothetical protein